MLKILQIIILLQGVFLIVALMANREKYQKPTFWLLIGSIASIIFYIIGDDDNGFFEEKVDWFFFDSSLFIIRRIIKSATFKIAVTSLINFYELEKSLNGLW